MKNFGEILKNAAGTVFLLAAAFFVCSTFLSMRAVFADPVAPQNFAAPATQSQRAQNARGTRESPRATNDNSSSRTGGATNAAAPSRAVAGRPAAATSSTPNVSNAVSRNVVSRNNVSSGRGNAQQQNRAVRARTGVVTDSTVSRISLPGTPIRGSAAVVSSTNYQYLSSKLYTGNYSNIIDSTTGLISAEAYSNCMESYYTCMDEICTARNAAQRRCACAGRVKAFADAEMKLETSNEELIKVSGELALLIATKGKDVSSAFKLTDAEKVMNCVSWQDAYKQGTWTTGNATSQNGQPSEAYRWCTSHGIYTSAETCPKPAYCSESGNDFGFDVTNLDGSGSDIMASLKAWADAKEKTLTITSSNDANVLFSFSNMANIVGGLTGVNLNADGTADLKDSLAETWGYELFEYAHNNVCNRVLDSCFNGIYEACGTPPSGGKRCTNGASVCPYNYNSMISVTNSGSYELNFVTANTGYTNSGSATCYGYNTASGDPYQTLRGPVADARRSVLQKYALDANADCDAYGEQLRVTAQNIGYQKVAAQQALQKKRLEFAQEEELTIRNDAIVAGTNFNECISEIYDCYNTQVMANPSWSTSRVKTYCAQIANVPHCYEQMICNPSASQFAAVIDELDSMSCKWSQDYKVNTCRNIVTLNEILDKAANVPATQLPAEGSNGDSAAIREMCLIKAIGTAEGNIRNWTRPCPSGTSATGAGATVPGMETTCKCQNVGQTWNGSYCM